MCFRTQRFSPRRPGFTLIELVIVLLIIGVLSTAAAPKYLDALAQFRATATTKRIKNDLELARRLAKQSSINQTVEFYPGEERYVLSGAADLDHPDQTYEVHTDDQAYAADIVSATFGSGSTVTFNMYGQPDNAGTVVVQSGNLQLQITVDANGAITVP
jgi:prepilin-type N-terminal cleavage/methylation domain-containing protein